MINQMKLYELVFEHELKLYARVFDTDTKQSSIKEAPNFKGIPEVYEVSNNHSKFKTFEMPNKNLEKIEFDTIFDYYKWKKQYKDCLDKFYGNLSRTQALIRESFSSQIGFEPEAKPHTFRTWFFDIETRVTNGYAKPQNPTEAISMIQIYDNFENNYYVLAVEPDTFHGMIEDTHNFTYIPCKSEKELLKGFKYLLEKHNPTILCGFNSDLFDIPYITNRCGLLGLDPAVFSPIGAISARDATTFDGIAHSKYDWKGIILLDYRELYQKYTFARLPKMNLETIATHELGEGKVNHSEYDNLEELYLENFEKFVEYGLRDVEILVELDKKIKAIDTAKSIAYLCGVSLNEVFGTLYQWQSLMYNTAKQYNKILPLKQKYQQECPFVGGWVKATPGKHKNVFSFDFTSLYPSNIRSLSIGLDNHLYPEYYKEIYKELEPYFTWYKMENNDAIKSENDNKEEFIYFKRLMENKDKITAILKKYDVCVAPNGALFKRESSVLEKLMTKIFDNRVKAKAELKKAQTKDEKDYWDLQQMVLKILMNSCYGSLALEYTSFSFGETQACAVTTTGRLVNRWVAYRVNQFLGSDDNDCPFTVQADTDSNYFSLPSADMLPQVEPVIKQAIAEVEELLNVYQTGILQMEQENKFDIFLSFALKRYIGRKMGSVDNYKFTGVSIVDKSVSKWSRAKLVETLPYIMEKTPRELIDFVTKAKEEYKKASLGDVCSIKGVSSLDYQEKQKNKFYNAKGIPAPIYSRGSIIHNRFVDENKISYDKIIAGDKVYLAFMKPCHLIGVSNVICFKNPSIITDTDLIRYVDWDKMFDKDFKERLKNMTDPLNISLDPYQGQLDLWAY